MSWSWYLLASRRSVKPYDGLDLMLLMAWVINEFSSLDESPFALRLWDLRSPDLQFLHSELTCTEKQMSSSTKLTYLRCCCTPEKPGFCLSSSSKKKCVDFRFLRWRDPQLFARSHRRSLETMTITLGRILELVLQKSRSSGPGFTSVCGDSVGTGYLRTVGNRASRKKVQTKACETCQRLSRQDLRHNRPL